MAAWLSPIPASLLALLCTVAACGGGGAVQPPPRPSPAPRPKQADWCRSIEAALSAQAERFACLPVPNFFVTGFYGPVHNPDRSDFVNGCFAGEEAAASRLHMSVRPVGQLQFGYDTQTSVSSSGVVDLGFIGPWAPTLRAGLSGASRLQVSVRLEDAEIRVLSSVAEILAQQYEHGELSERVTTALETCIGTLCAPDGEERTVYTAKVLAAIPVITVRTEDASHAAGALSVLRGLAEFEVVEGQKTQGALELRAKEKLNVAALLEPARPALERAGTCGKVASAVARRELSTRLRQLGLKTLAGRDLDGAAREVQELEALLTGPEQAFPDKSQGPILRVLQAIVLFANEQRASKPGRPACEARRLLEEALTSSGADDQLTEMVADVAGPLQQRLTQLANSHALACADPAWFRDEDGDGFGDEKSLVRAPKQPAGHVANALDCYDRNREARPGQTAYFNNHRGDGSFDYDCDGKELLQRDQVAGGCQAITRLGIPIRCWADAGWQKRAPACGREGQWLSSCEVSMLSCDDPVEELRRQTCH